MAPLRMSDNRTVAILRKAHDEGYGVLAQVIYDFQMAVALVKAAEEAKSPCMIMIFPGTLRQCGGAAFLRGLLELAHTAKIPCSVHMDHAQKDEDIEYTLDMAEKGTALDSIMIDCSHADTLEENITKTKGFVSRAVKLGMATEAELGRLEGGEAGIATAVDSQLTDPDVAEHFVNETGVQILAPCIGNRHGRYVQEPDFRLDILHELKKRLAHLGTTVCMHGTDDLKDALFRQCIEAGGVKVNINSWTRDPYLEELRKGITNGEPMPQTIDKATDAFGREAIRHFKLYGSAGKA